MLIWKKYEIEYQHHNLIIIGTCTLVVLIAIGVHHLWNKVFPLTSKKFF